MKFYLSFSLGFILFYCTFMRVTIFQYLSVIKLHLKKRFHKKSSMNVKVQNKNGSADQIAESSVWVSERPS